MVLGEKERARRNQQLPQFCLPLVHKALPPHNGLWLQGKQEEKAKEQP